MIEVASIRYGCQWGKDGHVHGWPMRIEFGAAGPEVTVDEMLEGRGHAVMLTDQLVTLVRGMTGLGTKLVEAGFYVALC
jgi:hypothetical protein